MWKKFHLGRKPAMRDSTFYDHDIDWEPVSSGVCVCEQWMDDEPFWPPVLDTVLWECDFFWRSIVYRKAENLPNVASWKLRWGQGQNIKLYHSSNTYHSSRRSETPWHVSQQCQCTANFVHRQVLICCAPSVTYPSSSHLLSFACSEVWHIDQGPIKNHNQMRTSGVGRGQV